MNRNQVVRHIRKRFKSAAEFNAGIREWGTDFRQIGRGSLKAEFAQQFTDEMIVMQVRFNRAVAMTGAPPPGTQTFGMTGMAGVSWNGRDVNPCQVLHFASDREFVSLAPAEFVARTVSVDERLLESVAANLGYTDFLDDLRRRKDIIPARPGDAARLVAKMEAQNKTPATLLGIVEDLVLMLVKDHPDTTAIGRTRYTRVVDEAVSYIVENAWQAPTVSEICAAVGVSLRTLDRAFNSRLGHGPKTSLQTVRLNGVRQELLETEATTQVREVANRWGFWHMGDFAMRYRREFGELPSESLST